MRNLKRALSLGLTAAMISGLMVMGSSAASSSYTDVADTDNVEAIEVLKAVGIMVGDENGDFNPEANVTRNEMAVVMSNLMEYNVATYADTSPFTDVPEWSEPYVAACWTNSITSGYDDTTYGGDDDVTTSQAALMVMKALGYFQYESDFGTDWQLETVSQGNTIDLFDGVESGVREAMTRNDVAQLVLNALEAGTVQASTSGSISVGDITIVNDVEYNYVTSNQSYAQAISDLRPGSSTSSTEGYIVELGERLYQGDLEKEESTDDFMRPATMWTYESGEIGTFSDEADSTWTTRVNDRDLYNAAGSAAYNNYTWYVYRNGEDVEDMVGVAGEDVLVNGRTSTDRWNNSGNGVLTEIYVDSTADDGNGEVVVTMIDTFVAEVTGVEDNGDGEYTVDISYKSGRPSGAETEFETEQEFSDDDIVLVTVGQGEIQSMALAETAEGTVDAVRSNDYVRIDGTTYNYNRLYCVAESSDNGLYNSAAGLVNLDDGDPFINPETDNDVTIYLDAYGYAVAVEGADDSIDDYLYVYGIDQSYGDYSARVVFADGTKETVDIDQVDDNDAAVDDSYSNYNNRDSEYDEDSNNLIVGRVYKWSQSGSDYDLESSNGTNADFEEVIWEQNDGNYGSGVITRDSARITNGTDADGSSSSAIADDDTVYVHVDDDRLWTGYTSVPSMTGIYGAAVKDDGVITVMFIDDSEGSTAEDDDFVYISDTEVTRFTQDGDTLYRYEGSYVNQDGSLVEGEFVASSDLDIDVEGLYRVTSRDSDDYATDVMLLVDVENQMAYWNDEDDHEESSDLFDNYATRAESGLLVLEGAQSGSSFSFDLANTASEGDFSVSSDTFYMVVDLQGDNDDTDDVSEGGLTDIETDDDDNSDMSAVFVLTVDDDGDETPLAEMVLVINPDPDADNNPSGSGGGGTSTEDPEDYETYISGNTVYVVLINESDTRSNVNREARNVLNDAGYTVEDLDYTAGDGDGEITVTDEDGDTDYFDVVVQQYWTVTVDDDDVYYVKYNEQAAIDIDGEGTGYVVDGTTYADYGTAYTGSEDDAVEIETGYYETVAENNITHSDISSATVEASNGEDEFVAVDDEITVTVTVPAGTVTGNDYEIALDVTGGGDATWTDAQSVTAEENADDDVELRFVISDITDDITAIEVTAEVVADVYDIAAPEIGEDNEDDIIQSVTANRTSATEDTTVTVTITLSGTVTAASGINLSVSGVTPTWATNLPDGVTNSGGTILLANGSVFDGETVRFTFTVGTDDVDSIEVSATAAV